jgi:hypothetical protein
VEVWGGWGGGNAVGGAEQACMRDKCMNVNLAATCLHTSLRH